MGHSLNSFHSCCASQSIPMVLYMHMSYMSLCVLVLSTNSILLEYLLYVYVQYCDSV